MKKRIKYVLPIVAVLVVGGSLVPSLVAGAIVTHSHHESNFYSSHFSQNTLAHSDSVNYTDVKQHSQNEYFYGYGTWVDTNKNVHKQYTSNGVSIYQWPSTNNPRIIVNKTGPTPGSGTTLELASVTPYTDNGNSATKKTLIYTFNTAWKVMSNEVPFTVPPSPAGLIVSSSSGSTKHPQTSTRVKVNYHDGYLSSNGGQHTDAIRWKWEFMGSVNSGWYYTGVTRKAANGYVEQAGAGETYYKTGSYTHKTQTSFCVYRSGNFGSTC